MTPSDVQQVSALAVVLYSVFGTLAYLVYGFLVLVLIGDSCSMSREKGSIFLFVFALLFWPIAIPVNAIKILSE
jgi:hypothetical protein